MPDLNALFLKVGNYCRRTVLDQWFGTPTPDNIMKVSMFSDLRMLRGDASLEAVHSVQESMGRRYRLGQTLEECFPPVFQATQAE